MYEVTIGMVKKENGAWNTDGMRREEVTEFESYDDAMKRYEGINPKEFFIWEYACRPNSHHSMRDEGFYKEIIECTDDGMSEIVDFDMYTFDDHASGE